MKLPWTGARAAALPVTTRAAVGADRPLGWARDLRSGATVVAGTAQVYAVGPAGEVLLARPWHLVDGGSWDRDTATLTVTWVDKEAPARWRFDLDSGFPEVFRARVQASVVLVEPVELPAGTARVVVRKDLADQRLLTQAILGPGVRAADPTVRQALDAALARVREQVGLD